MALGRKLRIFISGICITIVAFTGYGYIHHTQYDPFQRIKVENNKQEIANLTYTKYIDCEDLLNRAMQLDSSYTDEFASRMSKQVYNMGLAQTKSYYKEGHTS